MPAWSSPGGAGKQRKCFQLHISPLGLDKKIGEVHQQNTLKMLSKDVFPNLLLPKLSA